MLSAIVLALHEATVCLGVLESRLALGALDLVDETRHRLLHGKNGLGALQAVIFLDVIRQNRQRSARVVFQLAEAHRPAPRVGCPAGTYFESAAEVGASVETTNVLIRVDLASNDFLGSLADFGSNQGVIGIARAKGVLGRFVRDSNDGEAFGLD